MTTLTPIRAKVYSELRKKEYLRNVLTVNENLFLFMRDKEKIVFKNLFK